MAIPGIMQTGQSGMMASKGAMGTSAHNITNANTPGFSRQRVEIQSHNPLTTVRAPGKMIGKGVSIGAVERINDEYLEKQLRNGANQMSNFEEKDIHLTQLEDIFNEMNGEGLNRLIARYFNEFRKLANDPDSEAVRQSVREASQAMVSDLKRLRKEVLSVSTHMDARIEGYVSKLNSLLDEAKELNTKVLSVEAGKNASANDLKDRRDVVLKEIASMINISTHTDNQGSINIDIPGIGPLVSAGQAEKFFVERTPADEYGKIENALTIKTTATATGDVTHTLKGGKIGALLDIRDTTVNTIIDRLDDLAFNITQTVNEIHNQGFTRNGAFGINFFKPLQKKEGAAESFGLSNEVINNVNNIAAAAAPDSPGDSRVAVALSGLQNLKIMNEGRSTFDDTYNSIVSDVGVLSGRNRESMTQQKSILTQLGRMREHLSGVSIDEEVANLLQYQQAFDASAKVIQVADEMLKTVLSIKT